MIIDCDRCVVRGDACRDCVVGVFLGLPGSVATAAADEASRVAEAGPPSGARAVQLDAPERRALDVLADQGLVPRLRLVAMPPRTTSPASARRDDFSDVG